LFPLAAAINFFSVTALFIIAGILQKGMLAADIAVIQGAILAVFLSLSGNARNLILANNSDSDEKNLLCFRLLAMFPAVLAVMFLIESTIDVSIYLMIGLIIRKCSEWVVELQLANREKSGDFILARNYIWLNAIVFLILVLMLIFSRMNFFNLFIYIWALIPIVFSWSYIQLVMGMKNFQVSFKHLIPHIGSSTVIGVSTYVFRILIVVLAGKALAGQMFTAYALGGVMSSLYTYAIGPSLVLREKTFNPKAMFFIVTFCVFLGISIILTNFLLEVKSFSPVFIYGIGYSLIGGGVMILAQHKRLYILQVYKLDVFVPDALVNILITASVPFAYYLLGDISLALFFLWAAVLNFIFYRPLVKNTKQRYA
jgi:hypothetical protein